MPGENLRDPGRDREPGGRREHQRGCHQDLPALDLTSPDRPVAQLVEFGHGRPDNRSRGEVELAAPDPDPTEVTTGGRAHGVGSVGDGAGGVGAARGRRGSCHSTTLSGRANHGRQPEAVSGVARHHGTTIVSSAVNGPADRGDRLPQPAAATDDLGDGRG